MKKAATSVKVTAPATPAPAPAKKKISSKPKTAKIEPFPAPAVKSASSVAVDTTITAKIDVGFGNTLYVRGEGPGLSWEKGLALDCVEDDKWSITIPETSRPIVFKFLLNDLTWCGGEDYVVPPGSSLTVTPVF